MTNRLLKLSMLVRTDSYKHSHFEQYPPNSEYVSSYIEARPKDFSDKVVFFGLQAFVKEYMQTPITLIEVAQAAEICKAHGVPFNLEGWQRIVDVHNGLMPLQITALPEGRQVSTGVPLVQVVNTDPELPWLTSFIETALLRAIWYPTTVATLSRKCYDIIGEGLDATSDDGRDGLPFKLHDFGARGVSSSESAALGGLAHLVTFAGTDTMEGLVAAKTYYNCGMAGFSIPATEHSTITAWGREGELDAYANVVHKFAGKDRIYACVSDSYDIDHAVDVIWGQQLRNEVVAKGGTLVVRPDSGDPVATPIRVMASLYKKFGGFVNSKGFKVLHPSVRVIQGDGMNVDSIKRLIGAMIALGWSVDNIAVGMGGGLLQGVTRDTLRFAMKANAIKVKGESKWRDVYKQPASDPSKSSKAGRQAVVEDIDKQYHAVAAEVCSPVNNKLETIYLNGVLRKELTFDEVRGNTHI